MKNILKIIGGVAFIASATFAQQMTEITNWVMQDTSAVTEKTGEGISTSTFSTSGWYKATVPGTVLSTLEDQVVSGFTNLYSGTTISSVADIAGQQRRYWYRASFNVTFSAGQRVWLNIEGINYQAYIYVNGKSVGTMLGSAITRAYGGSGLPDDTITLRFRGWWTRAWARANTAAQPEALSTAPA